MQLEHVGLVDGGKVITRSLLNNNIFVPNVWAERTATYLSNFPCDFEMIIVWLARCEECIAICQMDVILGVPHLELFRHKVSIEHESAHILPSYTSQSRGKKREWISLLHWIFCPLWGQVDTRLGAGGTK
jgi:hypothetical protein